MIKGIGWTLSCLFSKGPNRIKLRVSGSFFPADPEAYRSRGFADILAGHAGRLELSHPVSFPIPQLGLRLSIAVPLLLPVCAPATGPQSSRVQWPQIRPIRRTL